MAEAKKQTEKKPDKSGGDKAPKLTRRKATMAKKTKTKKVKMVKTAKVEEVTKAAVEVKPQEKLVTARTKRLAEKAVARKDRKEPIAEEIEFVASMKLTEIDSKEYSEDEYAALLEMYDSTIKDIKEGEIVSGTVLGVSKDDVIVDVGFKSEGIIPLGEFPEPINIAVGDKIDVYLEQI